MTLESPAAGLTLARDSNLVALPCDDFCVRVLDLATRRLVRTFRGHSNRITDAAFSPDGRWLATASLDHSLRIWDLPTARCIDWLEFAASPTSLTWAPTSEFLATSHVGSRGISLWANKVHFGSSSSSTSGSGDIGSLLEAGVALKPIKMDQPRTESEEQGSEVDEADGAMNASSATQAKKGTLKASSIATVGKGKGVTADDDEDEDEDEEDADSHLAKQASASLSLVSPKAEGAITLSGLPLSAWQNLTRLDVIAARNKPKEAPKKPESAPFFLPTSGGLAPTFLSKGTGGGKKEGVIEGKAKERDDSEWDAAWKDDEDAGAEVEEDDENETDDDAEEEGRSMGQQIKGKASAIRTLGKGSGGRIMLSSGLREARTKTAELLRAVAKAYSSSSSSSNSSSSSALSSKGQVSQLDDAFENVGAHLASLSPSAADAEIRSLCLGPEDAAGVDSVARLLQYFAWTLERSIRFDITQAQLKLSLTIYQDLVLSVPELAKAVAVVKAAHTSDAQRLRGLLDKTLCMVGMLLGSQ